MLQWGRRVHSAKRMRATRAELPRTWRFNGVAEFTRRRDAGVVLALPLPTALQWGRRVHSAKRGLGGAMRDAGGLASMGSPSSLGEELRDGTTVYLDHTLQWGRRVHSAKRAQAEAKRVSLAQLQWGRRVHSAK